MSGTKQSFSLRSWSAAGFRLNGLAIAFAFATLISCQSTPHRSSTKAYQSSAFLGRSVPACYLPSATLTKDPQTPLCPGGDRFLLDASYPPTAIFLGFSSDTQQRQLIDRFIRLLILEELSIPVNILVPGPEMEIAHDYFSSYFRAKRELPIRIIPISTSETLWAQDTFQFAYQTGKLRPQILDLPYQDRDGAERAPLHIGLSCQNQIIPEPDYSNSTEEPGNGDYGGNIEALPGGQVMVGSTMTPTLKKYLKDQFEVDPFEADVSWLETGHIDELFTILPDHSKGAKCPFALIHASPAEAIRVLNRADHLEFGPYPLGPDLSWTENFSSRVNFDECDSDKLLGSHPRCKELLRANWTYDSIIKDDLNRLKAFIDKTSGCSEYKTIALPQLFAPGKVFQQYGQSRDGANAFNQNSVNQIILGKTVFVAEQSFPAFSNEIRRKLGPLGLTIEFVNGDTLHGLQGGIHCTVNISRACRSR